MAYADLKRLILKSDIKLFEHFIISKSIDIEEMVPKSLHDPEIDKIRKSDDDYTFVDLSAYYGVLPMFQYFISKIQFKIILESNHKFPLIFYALKGNNNEIINYVFEKRNLDENLFNIYDALYFSLKLGNINYLNKFFELAKGQRPDTDPETILYDIFQDSNQIKEHKIRSPLKIAIKSRNIMCVAFILNISQMEIPKLINTKAGKGKKQSKITPLHIAARYGCGDIMYLLITLNPKMIKMKGTDKYFLPFVDAVKYNLIPLNYEEFFKHGVIKSINEPDSTKNNALHYAIKNGNINAVNILLAQNNIDVNAKGEDGKTPIHLAAQACSFEILTRLLNDPNLNIFLKDDYDNLAIHEAAESNWPEGFLEILSHTAKKIIEKRQTHASLPPPSDYALSGYSEPSGGFGDQQINLQASSSISINPNISNKNSQFGINFYTSNDNKDNGTTNNSLNPSASGFQFRPYLLSNSSIPPKYTTSSNIKQTIPPSLNPDISITNQKNNNNNNKMNSTKNCIRQNSTPNFQISPNSIVFQSNDNDLNPSHNPFLNNNNQSLNSNSSISNNNNDNDHNNDDGNDTIDNFGIETALFSTNKMGLNCIHIASIKNCTHIFEAIEEKYPLICERIFTIQSGLTGFTVLHYLAICGHDKLLNYILDIHKNIYVDIHGKDPIVSPLYLASKFNQDKCVKVLKLHGAQTSKMTKRLRNPSQYIHYSFMQVLLFADENLLKNIFLDEDQLPPNYYESQMTAP